MNKPELNNCNEIEKKRVTFVGIITHMFYNSPIPYFKLLNCVIGGSPVSEDDNLVDGVFRVQEINNDDYLDGNGPGDDEKDIDDYCDPVHEKGA